MSGDALHTEVGELLQRAEQAVAPAQAAELAAARRRLAEPLRVAIAGRVKAGKSTLLNALVGEELAPTDASECTRIVTWYRQGATYAVHGHLRSGESVPLEFRRTGGAVEVQLGEHPADDVDHLEVQWPSGRLESMTLIDTPGIESLSADVSARAEAFLDGDDDAPAPADALLYLMQHVHPGDVRMLEAFRDDDFAQGTPVNALGILSRADEIGSCRLDAMAVARRATERFATSRELRNLCLTVVPIAGLAAQAATTVTEAEFATLTALAGLPGAQLGAQLLTADRFVADDPAGVVPADARQAVLRRLGLFALRAAIDAVRAGRATTSRQLADVLLALSGLPELQSLLQSHFAGRARVLKASSALLALDAVLRDAPETGAVDLLRRDSERLRAGVHEFTEMRVITALRAGQLDLDEERSAELERVLGGDGTEPAARVGLPPDAPDADVLAAAAASLESWRQLAGHPLSARPVADAAFAAARSCEGVIAALYTA